MAQSIFLLLLGSLKLRMTIPINGFPNSPSSPYHEARSQIKSGDILLCSGNMLFSSMIKKATGSVWSHVAFILRVDSIDRIMVLESVESKGVRTVPLSSYAYNYDGSGKGYPGKILIARHHGFDNTKIGHLSRTAVDLLGYPYGYVEILNIARRLALKFMGSGKEKEFKPDNAYICSEYAYECYQSVGIKINHDPAGFVTPSDFAKTPEVNTVCSVVV
jgi:hypothetical protein